MEIFKISYGYFSSVIKLFIFFIIRNFKSMCNVRCRPAGWPAAF